MKVSGIILAAGASRRMGRAKATLPFRGGTFLSAVRDLFRTVCVETIVVGAPGSAFDADVINPEPERGMLSSLKCGLERVSASSDGVMFTLVDLPAVKRETVSELVAGWRGEGLRIPRYQGKRGHPVLASRALIGEFLEATGTPRDVIARHEREISYSDVDDAGVVMDADTQEEYQKLVANG